MRARAAMAGRIGPCGARGIEKSFFFIFLNLCHVPGILAHGEVQIFAVCQDPWHTANFEHGAVSSRRYRPPWPTPPSCALVCRVPDKRHTAKPALPSWLVAVEDSSWAAHGEHVCHVFWGLRRMPWAHDKWPESGREWEKLTKKKRVQQFDLQDQAQSLGLWDPLVFRTTIMEHDSGSRASSPCVTS